METNKLLIEAAKKYLAFGWRVIPTNKKSPCVDYKELGLHNIYPEKERLPEQKLAFAEIFLKLFEEHPEATGIAAIIDRDTCVLDLDSQEAVNKYQNLINESVAIKTYRGIKLLFNFPTHYNLIDAEETLFKLAGHTWKANLEDHVEALLESHLCELPPSKHPEGVQYKWLREPDFNDPKYIGVTLLPSSLEKAIREYGEYKNKHGGFALGELEEILDGLPEGEGRNDAAYRLACHYIGKGDNWESVELKIIGWNQKNNPPLSRKELDGTLRSAKKHYDEKQALVKEPFPINEITEEELTNTLERNNSLKMPGLMKILPQNHFINIYTDYVAGLTDAYLEFNVCGGFWLLSAATQGKCYLKLKQQTLKPNLYITLIGFSTTSRKTTAINKASEIWSSATSEILSNNTFSFEGYIEYLATHPVSNFVHDEVAGLYDKYHQKVNHGVLDADCTLFDGKSYKKTLASKGKGKVEEFEINNPFITHFYATTLDSFQRCMTLEDFTNGYGVRHLYGYATYAKKRKDIDLETTEDIEKWSLTVARLRTLYRLFQDSQELKFDISKNALKTYNLITAELEEKVSSLNNSTLSSAVGRLSDAIFKLAMLIELGYEKPRTTISAESVEIAALLAVKYFLPCYVEMQDLLAEDAKRNLIERVLKIFRNKNGVCTRSDLINLGHLLKRERDEALDSLLECGAVEEVKVKNTGKIILVLKNESKPKIEIDSLTEKFEPILSNLSTLSTLSSSAHVQNTFAENAEDHKTEDYTTLESKNKDELSNSRDHVFFLDSVCLTAEAAEDAEDAEDRKSILDTTQVTKDPEDIARAFDDEEGV